MATSSAFTRVHVELRRARTEYDRKCIICMVGTMHIMEADTMGSPAMHHFSTTSCRLPRTFQWETAQDFEPHRKAQPNRNTHKMGIEIEARRVVGSYNPHLRALVCSCWASACSAHRGQYCLYLAHEHDRCTRALCN